MRPDQAQQLVTTETMRAEQKKIQAVIKSSKKKQQQHAFLIV